MKNWISILLVIAVTCNVFAQELEPYSFDAPSVTIELNFLKKQRKLLKKLGVKEVIERVGNEVECEYVIDTKTGRAKSCKCYDVVGATGVRGSAVKKQISWKIDSLGRVVSRKDSSASTKVINIASFDSLGRVLGTLHFSTFVEDGQKSRSSSSWKEVKSNAMLRELSDGSATIRINNKNEVIYVKQGNSVDSLAYERREDGSYTVEYWKKYHGDSVFTIGREDVYRSNNLVESVNYVESKQHWDGNLYDNWENKKSLLNCFYDGKGRLIQIRATGWSEGEFNYVYNDKGLLTERVTKIGDYTSKITYQYKF